MHPFRIMTALVLLTLSSISVAAEGLISLKSPYSPSETMQRIEQAVSARELTVFAKIDHSAGAAKIGTTLRPTLLLIFGNPKGGTPLMLCAQTSGIDLPLKILVWQDQAGQVWLGYNDPAYLAKRHDASQCPVVAKLQAVLQAVAHESIALKAQ